MSGESLVPAPPARMNAFKDGRTVSDWSFDQYKDFNLEDLSGVSDGSLWTVVWIVTFMKGEACMGLCWF